MVGKEYAKTVLGFAEKAIDSQYENIEKASHVIFRSLKDGGLLHVFGCGHSHIFAEESFYRAGGLVPVNPIFETSVMLHEGAVKSSSIERLSGYASIILERYNVKRGESILIFSNSGLNSLPIEMAISAKEKGLNVIAVTSKSYESQPTRHKSNQRLLDIADIVIDNGLPVGDALMEFKKSNIKAIPGSSVVGVVILNALVCELIQRYEDDNMIAPVFTSGNVEGGMEKNRDYINEYRKVVKSL